MVTQSRTLRLGAAYGCTVAFWDDDPDDDECVVSSYRTLIGSRIPKSALLREPTVLGGRRYPTLQAFNQTLHHDVDFPVDAVYTWVDGADVAWLERKNAVLAAKGVETEDAATSAARFRNRDELRYSFRSLDMYAPWIRNIYVVTDRQVPHWLDVSHPRVRVVDHTEIFGNEVRCPRTTRTPSRVSCTTSRAWPSTSSTSTTTCSRPAPSCRASSSSATGRPSTSCRPTPSR